MQLDAVSYIYIYIYIYLKQARVIQGITGAAE